MGVRIELRTNLEPDYEPAPAFASEAEIKLAEKLRRQLEERYLGSSSVPALPGLPSPQGH